MGGAAWAIALSYLINCPYKAIQVHGPDGKLLVSVEKDGFDPPAEVFAEKIPYTVGDAPGPVYFSPVFDCGEDTDETCMTVSAPVLPLKGGPPGRVTAWVNMAEVRKILSDSSHLGETAEILFAWERDGAVQFLTPLLLAPADPLSASLLMGSPLVIPMQKALARESGAGLSTDYRGKEVLASWRHLEPVGWGMVAKIDAGEAFAPLKSLAGRLAVVGLLAALLAAAVSLWLGARAAEPVVALRNGARARYRDLIEEPAGFDRDEVGEVAGFLNRLARSLLDERSTREALEREIEKSRVIQEKLTRSHEAFQRVSDTIHDIIYFLDSEGNIIFVGGNHEEILGLGHDEIVGENFAELARGLDVDEREISSMTHTMARAGTGVDEQSVTEISVKVDGEERVIEFSTRFIRDESGALIGMSGTGRDITLRKKLALALFESLAQWQETFDAIEDSIALLDEDGNIQQCNRAAILNAGKLKEDIIGVSCHRVLHGTDDPIPECPFERMKQSRARVTELIRQGSRFHHVTVDPILGRDGEVTGAVHIVSDVTEAKIQEERANRLHRLHEQTISTIPSSILVLNQDLELIAANRHYLEGRKESMEELEGLHVSELFQERFLDLTDLPRILKMTASTGEPRDLFGVVHQSSKHPDKILNIRVRRIEAGDEVDVLMVITDVTRETNLQRELLQAQKLESIGQLAGGVAHDYNNNLTSILSICDVLMDELPESDPLYEDVTEMKEAAERSAALTRQLLLFSRNEIDSPRETDPVQVINGLVKMTSRLIGEQIEMKFELDEGTPSVLIDPGQLEQVLLNLAVNARDAMPGGGKLTVRAEAHTLPEDNDWSLPPGRYALLAVIDDGEGMDRKTAERVFDPFFTTKPAGKGTGLGLSTVYGVVKQARGDIRIDSRPGEGTRFDILLPGLDAGEDSIEETAGSASARLGGTESILLVEDEDSVRNSTAKALARLGYAVREASNAGEALLIMEQMGGKIDLLLIDVVMPVMSGPELARRVVEKYSAVKIIFMTGYSSEELSHYDMKGLNEQVIQKPFSMQSLSEKIRELLRSRAMATETL